MDHSHGAVPMGNNAVSREGDAYCENLLSARDPLQRVSSAHKRPSNQKSSIDAAWPEADASRASLVISATASFSASTM
jgi:hypothetical protein